MHELSVTRNILEIALLHAEESNARSITDIYLVIGQLSSFVDDCIQFYWSIIAEGTIAENAKLHFRRIPAEMRCRQCGEHYRLDGNVLACPACHSREVQLVTGDEFFVEAIEIEPVLENERIER